MGQSMRTYVSLQEQAINPHLESANQEWTMHVSLHDVIETEINFVDVAREKDALALTRGVRFADKGTILLLARILAQLERTAPKMGRNRIWI